MRILRGLLLGVGLSLVGSIIYLVVMIYASGARATGTTAIQGWTVKNPLYWTACILAFVLGIAVMRRRDKSLNPPNA